MSKTSVSDDLEQTRTDRIAGKTIRFVWAEGPIAGTTAEHVFHDDGTVTWMIMEGPAKGKTTREKRYAAFQVSDDVDAVSYLAATGFTLTVVLNFTDRSLVGFASGGEKEWHPVRGTFEIVD